jgi:hypothetical protein
MRLTKKATMLTKELILQHLTEEQIAHAFWPAGKELKMDKGAIESPFRSDKNPSMLIGMVDGG